jgi:pyrroline-5-carboxylate reductase
LFSIFFGCNYIFEEFFNKEKPMATIGFIGGGNMAEALIKGILSAKVYNPKNVLISDIKPDRLKFLADQYGVQTFSSNKKLAGSADIVILSVEPQQLNSVLLDIKGSSRPDTLFISIAAGRRIQKIKDLLGDVNLIRVMPNSPARIGQGLSGIYAPENAKARLDGVIAIFSSVGKVFVLDNEDMIDVITAVSGSGPAYFFLLMENMIQAAVNLGFTQELATDIVLQTAKGAALLAEFAKDSGQSPAQLREKIVSRGGTTEAALKIFAEGNFSALVNSAVRKAHARSKELSA